MDSTKIPRGIHAESVSASSATPSPTRPDPSRDTSAASLHLLPATASHYVAAEAVRQLDELSLIGYPILDPATRAVYATTIRLVAEGVVDG